MKFFLLFVFLSSALRAEMFETEYFSFTVPPQWTCADAEQKVFCNLKNTASSSNDVVLYCAYREKLPIDTMDNFKTRLSKIAKRKDIRGNVFQNKILFTKENTISKIKFMDSLQFASEWPTHYTRYLGTVHNNLALLCTFSVIDEKYKSYVTDFFAIIETLSIYPSRRMLPPKQPPAPLVVEAPPPVIEKKPEPPKEEEPNLGLLLACFAFAAGIIIYIVVRRRQNPPPPTLPPLN